MSSSTSKCVFSRIKGKTDNNESAGNDKASKLLDAVGLKKFTTGNDQSKSDGVKSKAKQYGFDF